MQIIVNRSIERLLDTVYDRHRNFHDLLTRHIIPLEVDSPAEVNKTTLPCVASKYSQRSVSWVRGNLTCRITPLPVLSSPMEFAHLQPLAQRRVSAP